MCRDVPIEDFLLLNGDLTFVHISTPPLRSDTVCALAASGSTAPEPSQQQTVRGPDRPTLAAPSLSLPTPASYQRIFGPPATEKSSFVEIDSNLKELLEMCVHRISAFANRPKSSLSFGIPASKKIDDGNNGQGPLTPVAASSGSVIDCDAHREPKASVITPAILPISSSDSFSCTSTISTAKIPENNPDPDLKDSGPRSRTNDVRSSSEINASVDERPEVTDLKRLSCSPPPPSPPCLPLPTLSDSVVGDTRVGVAALESCRIVLRDISIQPASVSDVVGASKSSARKESGLRGAEEASVSSAVKEEGKTEDEEEEGQRPLLDTASVIPSSSIGIVVGPSKNVTPPLRVDSAATEHRLLDPSILGSTEQRSSAAHGCFASQQQQQQQHPCSATSGDARRRPVVKDPEDAGSASSSTTSPNSSTSSSSTSSTSFSVATTAPSSSSSSSSSDPPISIPVLEKHGSGDETTPAAKTIDECGEEREMPQLTLYA